MKNNGFFKYICHPVCNLLSGQTRKQTTYNGYYKKKNTKNNNNIDLRSVQTFFHAVYVYIRGVHFYVGTTLIAAVSKQTDR